MLLNGLNPTSFSACGLKAIAKLRKHEMSHFHREAKCTISCHMSTRTASLQAVRRNRLIDQIKAIKYLIRAIRGHINEDGNLYQLLRAWSSDNQDIESYFTANKYTSHQTVNELIEILGISLLL